MKKLTYVIAAVCAMAIVAPSIASAETVIVKRHGHDWHHDRHSGIWTMLTMVGTSAMIANVYQIRPCAQYIQRSVILLLALNGLT